MTVAGLRAEFRRFDMNGDGRINRQELMKVLMNAGLEQKEAEKNTQVNTCHACIPCIDIYIYVCVYARAHHIGPAACIVHTRGQLLHV